ncbi:MAG: porin family protein [Bacteroidota bacterium]
MNKSILKTLFLFLVVLLFQVDSSAQQRFKAGVIAGLNASQIQNDDVGGYNRLRIQGGLRAIAIFTEKMDLNIELLYSQRGSYATDGSPVCFNGPLDITANYIEIPVLWTLKDWLHETDDYYRIQASAGLSYGRLISASSIGSCHDGLADLFNKNDVSFTIGAEYFATEHFTIGFRWSRSLNLLYNRKKGEELMPSRSENSLQGFFLSFRAGYIF